MYILCLDSSQIHQSIFLRSFSDIILHPDKQTYAGFPLQLFGNSFYMCTNLKEKTIVLAFHLIQVIVLSLLAALYLGSAAIWVNFLHLCFYIVQCDASSLYQNRNGLFLYQTWRLAVDYTGWGWKNFLFFFKEHSISPRGKRLMTLGKIKRYNEVFSP